MLASSSAMAAATYTWNNSGTDWNTASDWSAATAGKPSGGDTALFAGSKITDPNISLSGTIAQIAFGTDASNYNITASPGVLLGLSGTSYVGVSANNTSGTNTLSAPLVLASAGTSLVLYQAAGGTLVINGQITEKNAGTQLQLTSSSAVGGKIVLTNASSSFTGGLSIGQGVTLVTTAIGNNGSAGVLGTGTITLGSGGVAAMPTLNYVGAGETNNRTFNMVSTSGANVLRAIDTTGATGNLTLTGNITATSGTQTLVLNGVNAGDKISGAITQAGTSVLYLQKMGTGTWTLSGSNGYTGMTYVTGGNLVLDYSTTGTNVLLSTGTLRLGAVNGTPWAGSSTLTIKGAAGAANSQTFASWGNSGAGAAHIVVSPSVGGSMTANLGMLAYAGTMNAHVFGATTDILTNGQTVAMNVYSGASGNVVPTNITLNGSDFAALNSGTLTAASYAVASGAALISNSINDVVSANTALTAAGQRVQALRFNVAQDSTLTLGSNSTLTIYDSLSNYTAGTILVTSTVGAHATVITGGTLKAAAALSGPGELALIQNNTQGVLEIDSAIADYGSTGSKMTYLTKSGQGTVMLGGANTYSGVTYVNEGMLWLTNRASLSTGTVGAWTAPFLSVGNGATLALRAGGATGFTASDIATIAALGTGSTGLLNGSNLGFDTTNGDFSYSNVIANSNNGNNSIGVTKLGANTLTLGGANTYTGATNIQQGIVSISTVGTGTSAQGLGLGNSVNLGVVATSSGTLQYTGAAGTLDKNIYALGNGLNAIQNNGTGLLTLSGALVKNGTILVLSGGAGGISVSGTISGANSKSDLYVTNGTTTLTSVNTYNGPTRVYGNGVLVNGNTSGALPVSTTLVLGGADNSNGTFDLNGNGQTVAGLSSQGTGVRSVTNQGLGAATLTVTGGGAFDGAIADGSGVTALTVSGGNLVLGGNNTYSGATAVTDGTLSVNGSLGNSAVNISSPATLNGSGTINGAVVASGTISGGLTFANNVTINQGATASAAAFNGDIADNGTITSAFTVKSGKTLSGRGLVTNTVTVNGGTINGNGLNLQGTTNLQGGSTVRGYNIANTVNVSGSTYLTGTTSATTFSVAAGATLNNNGIVQSTMDVGGMLKGGGTVIGAVSVSGTLAPGDGIGTATIQGSLSMETTGVLALEVAGTAAGEYDQLKVSGNVSLAGTLDLTGLKGLSVGDSITLIDNIGTGTLTSGYFSTILVTGSTLRISTATGSYMFTTGATEYLLNYGADSGKDGQFNDVTLTVVPEPGSWVMLVGGIGMLAFGQRLRRGKHS